MDRVEDRIIFNVSAADKDRLRPMGRPCEAVEVDVRKLAAGVSRAKE